VLKGLFIYLFRQGDGTNEHGGNGVSILHEEIALVQMVQARKEGSEEMQSMCLSEKWRFVTMVGRIKECVKELRKLHASIAEEWAAVTSNQAYQFAMTGDLKYLLAMTGHQGCSSTFPCFWCVRTRKSLVTCPTSFSHDLDIAGVPILDCMRASIDQKE
jgi:hypothetical protein